MVVWVVVLMKRVSNLWIQQKELPCGQQSPQGEEGNGIIWVNIHCLHLVHLSPLVTVVFNMVACYDHLGLIKNPNVRPHTSQLNPNLWA